MYLPSILRRTGAVIVTGALLCAVMPSEAKKSKTPPPPEVKKRPLHKDDVYLPSVLRWERPAAAGPNDWSTATAHVNIAVFYPWGEFVGGRISVSRLADGELVADPKDDFSLRKGTWTRDGKDIVVMSQWVKWEKGEAPRKKSKNKPVKETWTTDPKNDKALSHYIVIGATEYVQADALQNPEALEGMFK